MLLSDSIMILSGALNPELATKDIAVQETPSMWKMWKGIISDILYIWPIYVLFVSITLNW